MRLNEQCGTCQSYRWCGRETCKTFLEGKVPGHGSAPQPAIAVEAVKEVAAKALKQPPRAKQVAGDIKEKLQAQADQVKSGRRDGKKSIWVSGEQARQLKMAAAKHGVTQEAIVAEGIAAMLEGKYRV